MQALRHRQRQYLRRDCPLLTYLVDRARNRLDALIVEKKRPEQIWCQWR
jgi:hypothetical protein